MWDLYNNPYYLKTSFQLECPGMLIQFANASVSVYFKETMDKYLEFSLEVGPLNIISRILSQRNCFDLQTDMTTLVEKLIFLHCEIFF